MAKTAWLKRSAVAIGTAITIITAGIATTITTAGIATIGTITITGTGAAGGTTGTCIAVGGGGKRWYQAGMTVARLAISEAGDVPGGEVAIRRDPPIRHPRQAPEP